MPENYADILIIGSGPAGLTAAQYGARANLDVLAVEQFAPGGQVLMIDVLENYPGNAGKKTGVEIAADMHTQAIDFGAKFFTARVNELKKEGPVFTAVFDSGEEWKAPVTIIATGASHRKLGIPGEDRFAGRGVSYCATCDGAFFKGKKIFVAGGGDAACSDAQYLSRLSQNVVLVHRRDRFRAEPYLAQKVLENENIEIRFNTIIKEIKGDKKISSLVLENEGREYEETADAVFIFAGTVPQSALVSTEKLKVQLDDHGYIITNQKMESSIPGLYAAGDVRSGTFRQVVVAAGEGAVAAHNAAGYINKLRGTDYS